MDKTLQFLFAAYSAIWVLIFVYLLYLGGRQRKIAEEIDRLKRAGARNR